MAVIGTFETDEPTTVEQLALDIELLSKTLKFNDSIADTGLSYDIKLVKVSDCKFDAHLVKRVS